MAEQIKQNEYLNRTIEFHNLYKKEIVPIFRSYEFWRKKELFKHRCYIIAAIAMCFGWTLSMPVGILLGNFNQSFGMFIASIFALAMIPGIIMLCFIGERTKKFALTIKTDCLPRILKVFGNIKWVNNKNIISNQELDACGLFAHFNKRETDDEFQGTYKGAPFRICETHMWYESGSGKNKTYVQIFKGVLISFQANKRINNRTIVATKGDLTKKNTYWIYFATLLYPIANLIGDFLSGESITGWIITILIMAVIIGLMVSGTSKKEEKLDEVKLEDPRFCNKFNAYSSDQIEARYLLTTSFIERFQNLKTAFGAKKAKCSFYGNQVLFAISTDKNLFEIGSLYKTLEDPKAINSFYDELSSILRMADYFKLDEKTGL